MALDKEAGKYKRFVMGNPLISSFMHLILGGVLMYVAALLQIV